jgi:hypothetical protein
MQNEDEASPGTRGFSVGRVPANILNAALSTEDARLSEGSGTMGRCKYACKTENQ